MTYSLTSLQKINPSQKNTKQTLPTPPPKELNKKQSDISHNLY